MEGSSMTPTLTPGQTYSRRRGFRAAEYGRAKWWLMGVCETDQATVFGTEYVHIEDVLSSKNGDVARSIHESTVVFEI